MVMHDPALEHLYVAIGEPGVVCVIDTGALQLVETIPTEPGAHTIAVDTERHTVYALLPRSRGAAVHADH